MIKPIVLATRPKTIVEIGASSGKNTFNILAYCKACDAKAIIVDPQPQIDLQDLQKQFGEIYQMMQMRSLEALPLIPKYDLILIDGDHNWYTVYHELKLVEKMADRTWQFPIVLLHDTEWPYGRRDMYYIPDSIPETFRKPYARKGIMQGKSELLKSGGINKSLNNAMYENGEKNGVLTAVEDFMQQSQYRLAFYQLHSNCGLGIIVPEYHPVRAILSYIIETSYK